MDFRIDKDFIASHHEKVSGYIEWRSPSNIALIKYWGKHGNQLPRNTSLSFTLSKCYTETSIEFSYDPDYRERQMEFFLDEKPVPAFASRIEGFLKSIEEYMPFLNHTRLTIQSGNSFPHSTGIASSASAMSALALCLCSLESEIYQDLELDEKYYRKASFIARLGSGSASRSVYGKLAGWGEHPDIQGSSDLYAVPLAEQLDPVFHNFRDTILVVSEEEKSVSSSAGHGLMDRNIFADTRYMQAENNLLTLLEALKNGDLSTFIRIVEEEALSLHALMMLSSPSYLLMKPGTIEIISRLREWRKKEGVNVCFTLDAGPNVHVLYPEEESKIVEAFILSDLLKFCKDGRCINDHVGFGPEQIL